MSTEDNSLLIRRIDELVQILSEASKAYYQESREIMPNIEYDALYDELQRLEEETGYVMSNSPTQRVGYEVLSELPKEKHDSPMLSLDKTKDPEALKSWLYDHEGHDKEALLSWKMDGLTNVLIYEEGELKKAVTRGNGEIGEIITNNAKVYANLPLRIPYKGKLVIRGEAVISYSEFERINSEIEDIGAKYKNPRNLCAGTVRQLNNRITAERKVELYAFALISTDPDMGFEKRSEEFEWLTSMGFTCVEYKKVKYDTLIDAIGYFSEAIKNNDFPSDGLVLTLDDKKYAAGLGRTAKFPRDAIAFKWKDELCDTAMVDIEWSASRTGLINPVAIFEPVEIEGTTVSRASIHNVSIMESLKLGKGDIVSVYKANMIIPQIQTNKTCSGTFFPPEKCPVCGMETTIREDDGVKVLLCKNPECPAKKIKSFEHFVARDAMNIDGLSESTLEKFVDRGFVKTYADIYRLNRYSEEIMSMEGFGKKSYDNLISAIDVSRETQCYRVLYGIGVPGVGVATAKLISAAFSEDMDKVMAATIEELIDIEGVGEIMAKQYVDFFADEINIALVKDLVSEVHLVAKEKSSDKLAGLQFVITGSVEHFANRDELKLFIEANGGKTMGSVSAKTSYLINNDSQSGSTKNKKAASLGIPVITEEEFLALLEK